MQVYCDAGCPVCIHKRRKDTLLEGDDAFYYCDECKSVFLCTFPLTRKTGIGRIYECLTCRAALSSIPLSKAFEIGLSSKITTRFLNGTLFRNVWTEHNVYQARQQRMLAETLPYWFEGGESFLDTDDLEKYTQSMKSFPGLTVPVLAEILSRTDIEDDYLDFPSMKNDFLDKLKEFSPKTIDIIQRSLESEKSDDYFSLIINLMCRKELFNAKFISTNIPVWLEGVVDLIGIMENGKFAWFIIVREALEDEFVHNLMNMLLSLHSLNFANLSIIYIISDSFNWITREIIKRQTSINTTYSKAFLRIFPIDQLYQVKSTST
ncbi:MAG: hypothetical protein ACXAEU_11870 [Candidatus Hodarchaeales archaeon]|jgi:hypothetical protein